MRKFRLLLVVLLAAALVWTGLWWLAARRADAALLAWIDSEHAQGRDWTCPRHRIGGFPIALAVHCDHPLYRGRALGQGVEAGVARLVATVSLTHPRRLAMAMQPPFTFRTSDGRTNVTARWGALAVDVGSLPDVRSLALRGADIALEGTLADGGSTASSKADTLDAFFTASQAQADPTLDFDLNVKGTAVPPLDAFLGGSSPADLAVGGRLDRADIGDARTPEQAMEQWRQNGGRIDIGHALVSRAGASATATGMLRLDDQHRLSGRLDAEFLGLAPIFQRYGIGGNVAAVTSLLSTFLGGGPPRAASAPGALDLPIRFKDGRVGVGPLTTDVRLTPLY